VVSGGWHEGGIVSDDVADGMAYAWGVGKDPWRLKVAEGAGEPFVRSLGDKVGSGEAVVDTEYRVFTSGRRAGKTVRWSAGAPIHVTVKVDEAIAEMDAAKKSLKAFVDAELRRRMLDAVRETVGVFDELPWPARRGYGAGAKPMLARDLATTEVDMRGMMVVNSDRREWAERSATDDLSRRASHRAAARVKPSPMLAKLLDRHELINDDKRGTW
jgi:hypothetical protein